MITENRKNLQETSNVIRELLGLSQPIQLSELKDIITQKFGVNLIEQKNCKPTLYIETSNGYEDCKSTLINDAPYGYQVTYNPDCSEREQLLYLSSILGQIMMCEQTKDAAKDVYTGRFQLLDKVGTVITDSDIINTLFRNVETLSDDIIKSETVGEILLVFAEHSNSRPGHRSSLSVAYDFQSETMLRQQTKDNGIYYVKLYKK